MVKVAKIFSLPNLLCAGALLTNCDSSWGQQPDEPEQQAFEPGKLYESFLGRTTSEVDAELAKVQISAAEERRFGQSIVDAYLAELQRQNLDVIDRGREVDYLAALVATLQPLMANKDRYKSIKIYVVNSDAVDARSFPGGTLFFFSGLLDFAGSEAAVAGIVGHELSHLDHGHQLIPLRRMKRFEDAVSSGGQESGPAR